jgi:undecaprenyl-diphosphatase
MSTLSTLILGLMQGITEFLPISSSGHQLLVSRLLGWTPSHFLIILGHLGTLLAIVIYMRRDLWVVLTQDRRALLLLGLATLPLFPLPFLLHFLPSSAYMLGFCFLATGMLLFISERPHHTRSRPARGALWIGLFQAMAILPGISRSGATISAARWAGWGRRDAVRFSFLLAIPAILGAMTWELLQTSDAWPAVGPAALMFVSAFGAGLLTLRIALRFLERHPLRPFAWYCGAVGVIALLAV